MRIFIILTGLFLIVAQVSVAEGEAAKANRADVVRLLQEISEQSPVREELVALGFSGEKLELAVQQSRAFMRDGKIAGYVADRIIAANKGIVPEGVAGEGLVFPLVDRGLGYLPTSELRYFYLVEHRVINALSDRNCGLAVKERLLPDRQYELTSRIESRMNTPALREYYRIQLKAARIGVNRKIVVLSQAAEVRIMEKINDELAARIAEAEDVRGLIAAYQNLNRVDNRRACAAGRLFMEVVLDMKGRDLRDALIFLGMP